MVRNRRSGMSWTWTLIGVGRDAEHVAKAVEFRTLNRARQRANARSAATARGPESDLLIAS